MGEQDRVLLERLVGEFGKARWEASAALQRSQDAPYDDNLEKLSESLIASANAAREALLSAIRALATPAADPTDGQMLDWLEANPFVLRCNGVLGAWFIGSIRYDTLRSAIRAALGNQGGEGMTP